MNGAEPSAQNLMIGKLHNRLVFNRRVAVLTRHLGQMIPASASVLDVGCGDGSIAKLVLGERPDISIHGIDVLVRGILQIPVVQYDGKRIPHPDKSFDTVTFIDVLHHADDPLALLKDARRVARKCIIIKDHNCDGLIAELTWRSWIGLAMLRMASH
jgi:2-polyprenyl-3-methyl-5-hydroxy-6-metoxy-1,4-benzoquinol methylase